jgi:predicted site-specific integrase-resolvase
MLEAIADKEDNRQAKDIKSVDRSVPEGARLLNLYEAATYTGLSYWTVRDYVTDGVIPVVKLPCGRQRTRAGVVARKAGDTSARKILIDKKDLDQLIEAHKETLR